MNDKGLAEIHAIMSGLKVVSTESTQQSMHESRLACGGLGYSSYAGIGFRLADNNIQETWEGDNNVLI